MSQKNHGAQEKSTGGWGGAIIFSFDPGTVGANEKPVCKTGFCQNRFFKKKTIKIFGKIPLFPRLCPPCLEGSQVTWTPIMAPLRTAIDPKSPRTRRKRPDVRYRGLRRLGGSAPQTPRCAVCLSSRHMYRWCTMASGKRHNTRSTTLS